MVARGQRGERNFDKREILKNHPLFGQLGPEAIERLTSYAHTKTFAAGVTIFARGDPGDGLFAVLAGTVRISNRSVDGKDAVFNLIQPGEVFGEIALLDGGQRTADAQALTDCTLMLVDRRDFIPLLAARPELAMKLIEILCARLRHTSEQIEDMLFLDLPARLAKTLLWLAANTASRRIAITQREIGQIVGMTRESANKQLRDWEERKWVRLERGKILVLDPDALTKVAEAESRE
ncbi:MAG: Crp/Fnr family transcriptional regulator [Alphaproteobacteria bacterium]|nr:Crp/Fnr family transcriptional regulator [Alphaproteobacteria bacterium]